MIAIGDADAVLILRSLGLWELVLLLPTVDVVLTGYVAEHELNSILVDLERAQKNRLLRIEHVYNKTKEWNTWCSLKKNRSVDKGEAECIAWAVHNAPQAVLVSHDQGARRAAMTEKLRVLDPLGLLAELVRDHGLDRASVVSALGHWEDNPHAFGRPKRFTTVESALAV